MDAEVTMPSKSPAQHRLMEGVAHNPKFAKKVGIAPKVGKDFVAADKAKRPSGQFQGKRESNGKMNGGGYGEAQHPQSHADFEKLGHS
jgi:hypothetical protein